MHLFYLHLRDHPIIHGLSAASTSLSSQICGPTLSPFIYHLTGLKAFVICPSTVLNLITSLFLYWRPTCSEKSVKADASVFSKGLDKKDFCFEH